MKPVPPEKQVDEEGLSASMVRALANRQIQQKRLEDKKMENLRKARQEDEETRRLAHLAELKAARDEKQVSYLQYLSKPLILTTD